jgi:hypothetical protein
MPTYTPEQTSTLFLAIFFLVVIAGGTAFLTAVWIFAKPLLQRRFEAQAAKHDADARLAESLVVTTSKQTDLTERLVSMTNDNGVTLRQDGHIMRLTLAQVQHIADKVGAARVTNDGPTTYSPAVEVSADGKARPVVLAQEVIHQEPNK